MSYFYSLFVLLQDRFHPVLVPLLGVRLVTISWSSGSCLQHSFFFFFCFLLQFLEIIDLIKMKGQNGFETLIEVFIF